MSPETAAVSAARLKLAKADKFMEMADIARSVDYYDVAVSLAVSAGINYCDALCLKTVGKYSMGSSHEEALALLRRCGGPGDSAARHLRPLLGVKSKAQYAAHQCSSREAEDALRHAERIGNSVAKILDGGA